MQKIRGIYFFGLGFMALLLFLLDILLGSASIPVRESLEILFGKPGNETWTYILFNFRLPKAVTALLVGSGLSLAGLLMQTLFRNPLAGPFVLGISSGASLGVALFLMSSSFLLTFLPFSGDWGVVLFAIIGSVGILIVVLLTSFVISDTITLLIIGIMIGSIASALVSVLQYFGNPDEIKSFLLWTFGSLSGVTWGNLKILAPLLGAVYLISFFMQKSLNTFLLGDNHARGLGTPVRRNRIAIILITSLAAGAITAFVGPIAFIGVAVPHLARNLFRTADHLVLIPAVIIMGAALMLACDIISQLPGSDQTLPINSVSALFGAPVVIWVILKGRKQSGYF